MTAREEIALSVISTVVGKGKCDYALLLNRIQYEYGLNVPLSKSVVSKMCELSIHGWTEDDGRDYVEFDEIDPNWQTLLDPSSPTG